MSQKMTLAASTTTQVPATEVAVTETPVAETVVLPASAGSTHQQATESRVAEISSLLSALEDAAAESGLSAKPVETPPSESNKYENKLAQVRLGIASGLFAALRQKHERTASHSLRVALGCSSWAFYKKLDEESHDAVELAALMHDIGKVGVPDDILAKPGRLSGDELAKVLYHRREGLKVLANCCSSQRVLDAVKYSTASFDGKSGDLPLTGEQIPLEARMIAIVDAFDAMTTDHLYRPAMSRERAIAELFECSETQFDPVLVKQFVDMLSRRQDLLTERVASRWLRELNTGPDEIPWQLGQAKQTETSCTEQPEAAATVGNRSLFEQKLIDAMLDGVIFVDERARIKVWNKSAERLTGVSAGAANGRVFTPDLLDMCNSAGRRVANESCPVMQALSTSSQLRQRLQILGRQGKHIAVDLHAVPVQSANGALQGATVMLRDAQPEASLEEKCDALHAEVTKDPLTKVANRAEFDRMQALFIQAHKQASLSCSLIMVDIDHFKSINDTFGHQAGDEAIITVANLLKSMCRSGDLVARYGGEEFSVLCADCGAADAASRAEQIRRKLMETAHSALGTKRITASFGVTELQAGDNSESMLRRADRALLMAKEQGRNQVVQLGDGMKEIKPKKKWWSFGRMRANPVVETKLTSKAPIDIAIEKLRGFVSDHKAKVVSTKENRVEMEVTSESVSHHRRNEDREVIFTIEIEFQEEHVERTNSSGFASGKYARTHAQVTVRPKRSRNRRSADTAERARLLVQSLKAYLMAREDDGRDENEPIRFEPTVA